MTIAVGFKCTDGIVLASDSQYTGGFGKTTGPKIFPLSQNEHYSVTAAMAGSAGTSKRAVLEFKKLLAEGIGDKPSTPDEIRDVLEDVLCAIHAKHVYPAPAEERPLVDFWLLVAVWTRHCGFALYRTDLTAVTPVEVSSSLGIGSYLGNYLIDLLWHSGPVMMTEDAKPVAAYIIKSAKDFVDGCGLRTSVRVLTNDGIDQRVAQSEISDAEKFFESMFGSLRICIDGAINVNYPPSQSIESLSHTLKLAASDFRSKQTQRKKAVATAMSLASKPGGLPNP